MIAALNELALKFVKTVDTQVYDYIDTGMSF